MSIPSPLATNLRTLTRIILLSVGILGLVGAGIAGAVWAKTGQVAYQSVPLAEATTDALVHLQGIGAQAPLLAGATSTASIDKIHQQVQQHLQELTQALRRAETLGRTPDAGLLPTLEEPLASIHAEAISSLDRQERQRRIIAQAHERVAALVAAADNLAKVLNRVRSNARTQVGASQRRSGLVNERIQSLLSSRRLLAQVDLWVERSRHLESPGQVDDVQARLNANADQLQELSSSLGDDLHEDAVTLVRHLREAPAGEGFLALRRNSLAHPADPALAKRAAEATSTFATLSTSLANRTGVMIDDLHVEVNDAREAAQGALGTLQQAADAVDSAALLAGTCQALGAYITAVPTLTSAAELNDQKTKITGHLQVLRSEGDQLAPLLGRLALAKERRALDEATKALDGLQTSLIGQDGLLAITLHDIEGDDRLSAALQVLNQRLQTQVDAVGAEARAAKQDATRTLGHLSFLSIAALSLLVTVAGIALFVAWRRSRSISKAILAAEEHQAQRAAVLAHLVTRIEEQITPLNQAAGNLTGTSKGLNHRAHGDEQRAHGVATTSRELADATSEVTRSAQEIQASITSISDDAQTTQRNAEEAAIASREAGSVIEDLAKASEAIAQSTAGVTAIANRTRLLALNASIEAASAGAAGRGFAVVANEVKQLALQTAQENAQIAQRVAAVQQAVQRATSAIGRIDASVGRASEGQSRIAAAVEQQTATTTEMVSRLARIAQGLSETSESMAGIAANAGETSRESLDLTALAEQLSGMAAQLDTLVKSQSASAAHASVRSITAAV